MLSDKLLNNFTEGASFMQVTQYTCKKLPRDTLIVQQPLPVVAKKKRNRLQNAIWLRTTSNLRESINQEHFIKKWEEYTSIYYN